MPWYFLILYIIGFLSLMVFLTIVFLWESSLMFNGAPYIPVPKDIRSRIAEALELKEGIEVYDLGCGDGGMLFECLTHEPKAIYRGIEHAWLPYLMARWRQCRLPAGADFTVSKGDFFRADLSRADRIFVYLYPRLMDQLLPKLERELKPGARLVSCDFTFKNKQPIQTIDLQRPPNAMGQKLLVYQF